MKREQLTLDGQWQFWTDKAGALAHDALGQPTHTVQVPAPWQSQGDDLRYFNSIAWYRREFDVPANWLGEGRILNLHFGAVDYFADVWVNGQKVGAHEGGYTPFDFDIAGVAKAGKNEIVVRVADEQEYFPEIPHGKQSWYGPLSGLWQSVTLELRPAQHIRALRITPSGDEVNVITSLSQPLAAGDAILFEVIDPDGVVVASADAQSPKAGLRVASPKLWDIDTPHLYTLRATLNGDTVQDTFGFRTIETKDGQLVLNGRPIYLRSALDQDYYPDLICTPPSLEYIEKQFLQAKHMGLNNLRIHIKVGDPRYYEAADKVGLLIWTEMPNWQLLTKETRRRARETFDAMIERDWNRPSIIIRTIINEAWGVDIYNPEHRKWISDTYDYLKSVDPSRLVVGNSACHGNFHVVSDLEDFHIYYSIPDHQARWRTWVNSFAKRPVWSYAHVTKSSQDIRKYMLNPWADNRVLTPAPDIRRKGDEPLLVSEFGNWGLPELSKLRKHYNGDPWWFETGYNHGAGEVSPHGIDNRFAEYHLTRAFPSLDDLSRAAQNVQLQAMKFEIEQMRLHDSIKGYVITEFTDVHWECNGLLDMARNPKSYYDEFKHINADDVIVPDSSRVAFWSGETVVVKLAASHYSQKDLSNGKVVWQLEGADVRGEVDVTSPAQYGVTPLDQLTFKAPKVQNSAHARLTLRWLDGNGDVVAQNWVDLYLFLKDAGKAVTQQPIYAPGLQRAMHKLGYNLVDTLEEAEIVVTPTMTDTLREYLLNGGKVVWLAESDDAQQAWLNGVRLVARNGTTWQGDWATNFNWLNQDKLFKDIPTDHQVNFAFADLTPEHVLSGVHAYDFETDVHAGLFVGWVQKPVALVAERRIGRGKYVASTFRLRKQLSTHPVAAVMLRDLIGALEEA
jgi:hypothetical protein